MIHSFDYLQYHVIFSTKGSRPLIMDEFRQRLFEYAAGVARKEFGAAIAINATENHLHALLSIKPTVTVSSAIGKFKSLTSGWINRTFRPSPKFFWQRGYGAFVVSESLKTNVMRYIANQQQHHRKVTFEEEFIAFLKRHKIPFDPGTMWE